MNKFVGLGVLCLLVSQLILALPLTITNLVGLQCMAVGIVLLYENIL